MVNSKERALIEVSFGDFQGCPREKISPIFEGDRYKPILTPTKSLVLKKFLSPKP